MDHRVDLLRPFALRQNATSIANLDTGFRRYDGPALILPAFAERAEGVTSCTVSWLRGRFRLRLGVVDDRLEFFL